MGDLLGVHVGYMLDACQVHLRGTGRVHVGNMSGTCRVHVGFMSDTCWCLLSLSLYVSDRIAVLIDITLLSHHHHTRATQWKKS